MNHRERLDDLEHGAARVDRISARAAELVQELAPLERLVVMLRYAERLTWEEIAAVTGRSDQAVRAAHARVVGRLRRRTAK